jgi:hypothetical protein
MRTKATRIQAQTADRRTPDQAALDHASGVAHPRHGQAMAEVRASPARPMTDRSGAPNCRIYAQSMMGRARTHHRAFDRSEMPA